MKRLPRRDWPVDSPVETRLEQEPEMAELPPASISPQLEFLPLPSGLSLHLAFYFVFELLTSFTFYLV